MELSCIMGLVRYNDHTTDALVATATPQPPPGKLLFGMEFECSWAKAEQQQVFLHKLDKAGINDKNAIAKHDGSLPNSTISTEIVSIPMEPPILRDWAHRLGTVVEELTENGLFTKGAGVHIHVSRSALDRNQVWRIIQAIYADTSVMPSWQASLTGEHLPSIEELHTFWNKVCLRGSESYCSRQPIRSMAEFERGGAHGSGPCALIMGARTPTIEFRMFRTPRSRRVLTSYVDVVLSLLDFAKNPPESMLDMRNHAQLKTVTSIPLPTPPTSKATWQVEFDQYVTWSDSDDDCPIAWLGIRACSYPIVCYYVYDSRMGLHAATRNELEWTGMPGLRTLRKRQPDVPQLTEAQLSLATSSPGAIGWTKGLFPLADYRKHVLENADTYPSLAARLLLPRFAPEAPKPKVVFGESGIETPHSSYQEGCVVRDELWDQKSLAQVSLVSEVRGLVKLHLLLFKEVRPIEATTSSGLPSSSISNEFYDNNWHEAGTVMGTPATMIHLCKGATEKGGEE